MRVQKRNPWLTGLGVVLAVIALAALSGGRADALVASDQAGTIAIFPKVIADGTRDTLISLTNTSNMQVYVHCEYVQGAGICESSPLDAPIFCTRDIITDPDGSTDCTAAPGERCLVNWQSQNFDLILTRQQPTIWRVSTGRIFDLNFNGEACEERMQDDGSIRQVCPGFFFTSLADPLNPSGNLAPPPGSPFFRGELKCFQVDSTLSSVNGGDALKGEATIESVEPASPRISTYNSINIQGENGTNDLVLKLDGTPSRPAGDPGEFNACPEAIEFTHFGNGADNIVADGLSPSACASTGCPVRTEVTIIPCTEDFEGEEGARVPLLFEFFDEFETFLSSASPILDCWATYDLATLTTVQAATGGSTFWKTRITPQGSGRCRSGANKGAACSNDAACGTGGVCGPVSSILAIVEEFYDTDVTLGTLAPGSAANNTTMVSIDNDTDVVRSGACRGALGTSCQRDADCTASLGRCRIASTSPCSTDADCVTAAADCTAAGMPAPCCTGLGTGPTCVASSGDDFCDRCMFDEIIFNSLQ